jgi:hypothetical protein
MIVLFTVNYFADANADAVITDSVEYSATQKVIQEFQRKNSVPLQSFSELKDRTGDIYTQLSFLMESFSLQNIEPGNIALASLLSLQYPNTGCSCKFLTKLGFCPQINWACTYRHEEETVRLPFSGMYKRLAT